MFFHNLEQGHGMETFKDRAVVINLCQGRVGINLVTTEPNERYRLDHVNPFVARELYPAHVF